MHIPTGALGAPSANDQDWQQYRLSQNQVDAFHRDGFLAGVQVLNDHQVEALCAELAGLMEPSHPTHELFHEYHSNESSNPRYDPVSRTGGMADWAGISRRAVEPGLPGGGVSTARRGGAILARPALLQTGESRGVVAWHQDYSYWTRTQPMAHLTCWIALDDSTSENGCLYYVPGSHKWNLLPNDRADGRHERNHDGAG